MQETVVNSYYAKGPEIYIELVESQYGTFYKVILTSPEGDEFLAYGRRESRAIAFAYRKYADHLANLAYGQDQVTLEPVFERFTI